MIKCPDCNVEVYPASRARTPGTVTGIGIGAITGGIKGASFGGKTGAKAGKSFGPTGAVIGGVAGVILGALTGAATGAAAGHKLGELIDEDVITEYYCPKCKRTFNLRKEMREAKVKQTNAGMAPGI